MSKSGFSHHRNLPNYGVVLPKSQEKALALIEKWAADESGYEEKTWPELQQSLDKDRLSDRPLFRQ